MSESPPGANKFLTNPQTVLSRTGCKLQTYTAGHGDSVIVLESGAGQGAANWGLVAEALIDPTNPLAVEDASAAKTHPPVRVVAYDRAGYGGSEVPKDDRSLSHLADDLISVLESIELSPSSRIVIVGHSWGGPILRVATARILAAADSPASSEPPATLAKHITGVVLVDVADEFCHWYFSRKAWWILGIQSRLMYPFYWTGILAFTQRIYMSGLPEPYLSAALNYPITSATAMSYEIGHIIPELGFLRDHPEVADIKDVKVAVISAAGADAGQDLRDELNAAHKRRADKHNGKYILAEKSDHMVIVTEPSLVAETALRLLK